MLRSPGSILFIENIGKISLGSIGATFIEFAQRDKQIISMRLPCLIKPNKLD